MRRLVALVGVMIWLGTLGTATPARAQPSEDLKNLRKEIDALKEGQKALQDDLREIKKLLQARPTTAPPQPPTNVVLDLKDAPFLGDKDAKITIVEFTDYQ